MTSGCAGNDRENLPFSEYYTFVFFFLAFPSSVPLFFKDFLLEGNHGLGTSLSERGTELLEFHRECYNRIGFILEEEQGAGLVSISSRAKF